MKRLLLAAALLAAGPVLAHDYTVGELKIVHPWTRVTSAGAKVAGGYLTITNTGKAPDRLVGGSFVLSRRLEVHEMRHEGGVMRMRELEKGLEIRAGETVALKPGSYHVMLMDLTGPLEEGKPVKGTLVFERAGKIEIEYKVEPLGATTSTDPTHKDPPAAAAGGHGKDKHKGH